MLFSDAVDIAIIGTAGRNRARAVQMDRELYFAMYADAASRIEAIAQKLPIRLISGGAAWAEMWRHLASEDRRVYVRGRTTTTAHRITVGIRASRRAENPSRTRPKSLSASENYRILRERGCPCKLLTSSYCCTRCGKQATGRHFRWWFCGERKCWRKKPNCAACLAAAERQRRKGNPEYLAKCRAREQRVIARGGDQALRLLFNRSLGSCRREARLQSFPCEAKADMLIAIFHSQRGCCYYTGMPLLYLHNQGKQLPHSLSIDRLDPAKGYVAGNMVLCTLAANTAKGALTEDQFYDFCRLILRRHATRSRARKRKASP